MADAGMMAAYPQVFVVDSQAPCGPVPVPVYPRRGSWRHRLLVVLVGLCLLGVVVEACCIYNLHKDHDNSSSTEKQQGQSKSDNLLSNEISPVSRGEKKPAALLKGSHNPVKNETGILLWTDLGDGFLSHMTYKDGLLTVRQEGVYFLYSKIALTESMCGLTTHKIVRQTQRYSKALDLMLSVRYLCPKTKTSEVINSYLGGAFLLHVNDSVLVKLEGPAKIRPSLDENIFGAFML